MDTMPTSEETADALKAGRDFHNLYPAVPLDEWDNPRDRGYFRVLDRALSVAPDWFRAGWLSAQREAKISRRVEESRVE